MRLVDRRLNILEDQHSDLVDTLKQVGNAIDRNFVRLQDRIDELEVKVHTLQFPLE